MSGVNYARIGSTYESEVDFANNFIRTGGFIEGCIVQVPPGDSRIGDGTLFPIAFTRQELELLLVGVKTWAPTASSNTDNPPYLPGVKSEWWNQGDAAQLPSNSLPNNNIWYSTYNSSDVPVLAGFITPWTGWPQFGGTVSATPYFDIREKYTIAFGFGVSAQPEYTDGSGMNIQVGYGYFLDGGNPVNTQTIYYDGASYYPLINATLNNIANTSTFKTTMYPPNTVACGTFTIMGKTCNIYAPSGSGITCSAGLAIATTW